MASGMSGKLAVVTGGSNGIGRELARGLAERGAAVVVISRPGGRGEDVTEALRRDTGNPEVRFMGADLSSMAEVRDVASRVRDLTERVDVLANNAGAYFVRRQETADGFEATFALNHLAAFLLTHLLMEPLLAGDGGRVVVTASSASRAGRLHFDDPMLARRYNSWAAYGQSKLANIAFTTALARRLEGSPVTVNAFHPGFVNSGFGTGPTVMNRLVRVAARVGARTPQRGADTGVYLAASDAVAGVSGEYFSDRRRVRPTREARDEASTEQLWRLSEDLVKLTDEERAPLARIGGRPPA